MITEWIMVIITAVYVIATIFISYSNYKSAEATREQVIESKRQYEDRKRLEIMPYIQFEKIDNSENIEGELNLDLDGSNHPTHQAPVVLRMKNIGNGTAKDISWIYQCDNCTKSYDRGAFPIQALSSFEFHYIKINFYYTKNNDLIQTAKIVLRFYDLLDNKYEQQLSFEYIYVDRALPIQLNLLSTSKPYLISSYLTF